MSISSLVISTKENTKPFFVLPLILQLLHEEPMYGYQLAQAVKQRTNGRLEPTEGVLYPLLYHLEKSGLITNERRLTPDGRERTYFRLTERGEKSLTAPLQIKIRELFAKLVAKLKAWVS